MIDILIWSECPRQGAIFVLIVVSTYNFFEALFVAIFETRLENLVKISSISLLA